MIIRILVIPTDWKEEASQTLARLNRIQFCYFFIVQSELESSKLMLESLSILLNRYQADSCLWIIPFEDGKSLEVKQWPSLISSYEKRSWVNGFFPARNWVEVANRLIEFENSNLKIPNIINVTCQYEFVYTNLLDDWEREGARSIHPGDYFKSDFLDEFSKFTGNWVYFGHAEGDRLRGYGHLEINDLIKHHPPRSLNLTLWFTCSTLDPNVDPSIGICWFMSGATFALLASAFKISTYSNQLLSKAWIMASKSCKSTSIASVILQIYHSEPDLYTKVLSQYSLLGFPWVDGKWA